MTRINIGISPKILSGKHLLAEHREIKRIPNMIKSNRAKIENIPDNFTLGKGHCKFFYNKLGYLLKRYKKIYRECIKRGYNVTYYAGAWDNISKELMADCIPTKSDLLKIKERLLEKDYNYYKKYDKQI